MLSVDHLRQSGQDETGHHAAIFTHQNIECSTGGSQGHAFQADAVFQEGSLDSRRGKLLALAYADQHQLGLVVDQWLDRGIVQLIEPGYRPVGDQQSCAKDQAALMAGLVDPDRVGINAIDDVVIAGAMFGQLHGNGAGQCLEKS